MFSLSSVETIGLKLRPNRRLLTITLSLAALAGSASGGSMMFGQQANSPDAGTGKPALNAPPTLMPQANPSQNVPGAALQQPSLTNKGTARTWQPANSGTSALPVTAPVARPTPASASGNDSVDDGNSASPAAETRTPALAPGLQQPPQAAAAAAPSSYIHSVLNAPPLGHVVRTSSNEKLVLPRQTLYLRPNPIKFDNSARQMTTEGYLVIDIPKRWKRNSGPGLLFCVPDRGFMGARDASIYVGSAQIDPKSRDREAVTFKSASAFIASDIDGFKAQFPNGIITADNALELPLTSAHYYVYSFQSGSKHNAFEEVVYVDEGTQVLALTLSADSYKAFRTQQPDFYKFAQSYQGTIPFTANANVQ